MRPTLTQILDAICENKGIDRNFVLVNKWSRKANIQEVKQLVCLIGQNFGYHQEYIGAFLGLSHSTVYCNKRRAEGYVEYDCEYAKQYNEIMETLVAMYQNTQCDVKRVCECLHCEVFKNHQGNDFLFGFYCPIKGEYVKRDDFACENILSDGLPF